MFYQNDIDKHHFNKFKLLIDLKNSLVKEKLEASNISMSQNFVSQGKKEIEKKLKLLNLNNVVLIQGDFIKTLPKFFNSSKNKIFSANIDCDLYESYKIVLPYVWKNLEKKGYAHLDEYYSLKFPGARIAINEFCEQHSVKLKKQKTPKREFERWYFTR